LAYVAMTRARDFLYVTWPLRYYHKRHRYGDRHSYAQLSRFITESVRAKFDQINFANVGADGFEPAGAQIEGDVRLKLRAMWG